MSGIITVTHSNEFKQDSVLQCLAPCVNKLPNAKGRNVARTDNLVKFFFPVTVIKYWTIEHRGKGFDFYSQLHTMVCHSHSSRNLEKQVTHILSQK